MTPEQTKAAIQFLKCELLKRTVPKILIVEDDQRDLALLLGTLAQFKCDTLVAENAVDAIKLIDNQDIALVFLDLRLPIVPGVHVITERKHLNANLHFVVVTGAADSRAVDEALRAGAAMVFEKPLTYEQLEQFLTPITPLTHATE